MEYQEDYEKERISHSKHDRLIEHFIAGTTARTAASLVGVHRNSAAFYFHPLREVIAYELEAESEAMFGGEIEVDESYFGGRRKGKRGRGAAGKIPVFGLLKRGGKVYTRVIPDAAGRRLVPIIERKVTPDSIVYSDSWRGYNALDVSSFKHFRITHSELFAEGRNHINGIENFWNQAKRHMRKFNGVPKEHFGLYLKEGEWRFNTPDPKRQLTQLRQWVRKSMGSLSRTAPIFIPILCIMLAACTVMRPSTLRTLMTFDPMTADPFAFSVVVDLPAGIKPLPDEAQLIFSVANIDQNMDVTEVFILSQTASHDGRTTFKVAKDDLSRLLNFQNSARALEAQDPDGTQGSISTNVTACLDGEGPKPNDRFNVFIQVENDGALLPLITGAKWQTIVKQLDGQISPDDPATKC